MRIFWTGINDSIWINGVQEMGVTYDSRQCRDPSLPMCLNKQQGVVGSLYAVLYTSGSVSRLYPGHNTCTTAVLDRNVFEWREWNMLYLRFFVVSRPQTHIQGYLNVTVLADIQHRVVCAMKKKKGCWDFDWDLGQPRKCGQYSRNATKMRDCRLELRTWLVMSGLLSRIWVN